VCRYAALREEACVRGHHRERRLSLRCRRNRDAEDVPAPRDGHPPRRYHAQLRRALPRAGRALDDALRARGDAACREPRRRYRLGATMEKQPSAPKLGLTPGMLNHAAYVTHGVGATGDFYTRILGMELASTIFDDQVPSTGDDFPYFHIFFRMADGSTIAFFEVADLPPRVKPTHPAYDMFDHMTLQAKDCAELLRLREWTTGNGV